MLGFIEMFIAAFLIERGLGLLIPAYSKISIKRFFGVFLILWGLNGQFVHTIESIFKKMHPQSKQAPFKERN